MREIEYVRQDTLDYAKTWALKRNPAYYDFSDLGGDCTNFSSQCLYAGCKTMNETKDVGWYYNSANDRAAAWTSVPDLFRFLTTNEGVGPYAREVYKSSLKEGDLIQLGNADGLFYHTFVAVKIVRNNIFIAAHSTDAYMRPLDSYFASKIRFLHILGVRTW